MWHNSLLKYEHRIKDKELHEKEQKIYTDFFFITIFALKELSLTIFSQIFDKRKFLRRSCKISRTDVKHVKYYM